MDSATDNAVGGRNVLEVADLPTLTLDTPPSAILTVELSSDTYATCGLFTSDFGDTPIRPAV